MAKKDEHELKLQSKANLQLKLSTIDTVTAIMRKTRAISQILGIVVGNARSVEIVDEYYDDDDETLTSCGCSFRRRVFDGDKRVTFKSSKEKFTNQLGVVRNEIEFSCTDGEFTELSTSPDRISKEMHERLGADVPPVTVRKQLSVRNHRTIIPLRTTVGPYQFCYDKYYYFHEGKGRYSEYFTEIEIEREGEEDIAGDTQIRHLYDTLAAVLDFEPHTNSKYERGKLWYHQKNQSAVTVYGIGMDIVGFSTRSSDLQKNMILRLNRLVKKALRDHREQPVDENVLHLPTGDGLILLLEDRPEKVIPIVFQVQQTLKAQNSHGQPDAAFSFRTALHAGPVFRYTDVNGNINVAGDGINMVARLLGLGNDWHILSSEEGFASFGRVDRDFGHFFSAVGSRTFKHGRSLNVYNVCDRESQCGNESSPLDT